MEILFAFTETDVFTEDLLEFSSDETLYAIQEALLENPKLGDVIKGTNGARKGRVANPKARSGKSGGFRFIYVYLEKTGPNLSDLLLQQKGEDQHQSWNYPADRRAGPGVKENLRGVLVSGNEHRLNGENKTTVNI